MEEAYRDLRDYTVTVDVTVDLERLKVPPMKATMYFRQPDRVRFASSGFALIPRESMGFTGARLRERFDVERVEERREEGGLRYELTLKPKEDRTRLRRLLLTVDPGPWTPERLAAPQPDGRTMEARFRHESVGGFRLPVALDVRFTAPDSGDADLPLPGQRQGPAPRNGTISVRFSEYRINTGLEDSFFEESDRQ